MSPCACLGGALLLVRGGLRQAAAQVKGVEAEQRADDERDAPTPTLHLRLAEEAGEEHGLQRRDQDADRDRDIHAAAPQSAALGRGALGQERVRSADLAAEPEPLREAGNEQQQGRGDPDRAVRRRDGDQQASERSDTHRDHHGRLPAASVGEPAKEQAADGPHEEADREHRERPEQRRDGVRGVEELSREERRENRVGAPVTTRARYLRRPRRRPSASAYAGAHRPRRAIAARLGPHKSRHATLSSISPCSGGDRVLSVASGAETLPNPPYNAFT